MRHSIDELLLDIWRDPAQKKALTRLAAEATAAAKSPGAGDAPSDDLPAAGGGALLVDYARAMLNSLMYMLGVRSSTPIRSDSVDTCCGLRGTTVCCVCHLLHLGLQVLWHSP